jgi:hypothetical protein
VDPWGVRALHPDAFLTEIFRHEQSTVIAKLERQAADRAQSWPASRDSKRDGARFRRACF